ncbi:MAG: FtsX-like permease family protein [Mycobacteriales bacterium]
MSKYREGAPVLAWVRLDFPRRWRSLAVLALLVSLAAGTVLTAVAGARRGMTAVARLNERVLPATTVALPNQPGFDWEPVRALPEVETLARFAVASAFWIEGAGEGDNVDFPWLDASYLHAVERPVVLSGRMSDPAKSDEAVVSNGYPKHYGKGVGDSVVALLYTPEQVAAYGATGVEPGPPAGPKVTLHIVGIVRSMWVADADDAGGLSATPALLEKYRANMVNPETTSINALIRLRGGESDLPKFRADLARVSGRGDIDTWSLPDARRAAQRRTLFEATCMLGFAVAALVASLLLVGQAIARYTGATVEDLRTLRALGMTSRQSALAAAAGPFVASVVGVLLGAGVAIAASRWFPIGSASVYEPTPGTHVDWTILGTALLVVPALVLLGAVVSGWLAWQTPAARSSRPSAVATAARRIGLPVPVTVGTRLALETGRGRTAVPVRPALVGAVTGVAGVLAAFTFSGGVADAAGNPARFGQTYQLATFFGASSIDYAARPHDVLSGVAALPDVTGVNDARVDAANTADGKTTVPLFSYEPVGKPLDIVLTSGRMPATDSDLVLAPSSADALHIGIGGRVKLSGSEAAGREMTVTGIGFVPQGPHNGYATGGYVSPAGYAALFGKNFKFHFAFVSIRKGADPQQVLLAVKAAANAVEPGSGGGFEEPEQLTAVRQLQQVQRLPLFLGVFLALLAIGTVGHALATAVRRRRHDLAVLRALGMTRRQARGVVVTQATVLALVGLVFGVPLGVALGRTVWRIVADFTPLQYAPPPALWALVLIGPVALLVCNALAAWPGRQAARLRIGHILRTE